MINSAMRKLLKFHFSFLPITMTAKKHTALSLLVSCPNYQPIINHGMVKAIEQFDHELNPDIFPLYQSINQTASHNKKKQKNKKGPNAFYDGGWCGGLINRFVWCRYQVG